MATLGMPQVPICKKSSQRQDEDYEIRNASQETLFETAALIVQDTVAESSVIDSALEDKIPRFELNEMRLGRILGRGGFCIAIEIERVKIAEQTSRGSSTGSNAFVSLFKKPPSKNFTDADISSNVSSNAGSDCPPASVGGSKAYWSPSRDLSRISIAQLAKKRSWRGGRFVLKRVLPELQSSNDVQFLKGIVDLAMESKFLSSLDHPNIIALCGISKHGPSDFIMLERLKETLSKRFRRWTQIDRQCKGVTGIFTGSKRKVAELYEARISAAYDVACAGDYLHQRNIVFRDLVSPSRASAVSCPPESCLTILNPPSPANRNQTTSDLTSMKTSRSSTLASLRS
jgi:serine/threonine protein kinase